jgi:HD-GYP domain-containing protein (c-di-GMP phosphodiesterase class II)
MSRLCEQVALELGRPMTEAELLRHASVLHDVGKIGLPDGILRKPGRLTDEELEIMRRHAADGAAILEGSTSEVLRLAEVVARTHHERYDGTGYPAGLSGEDIPLPGRIAAVCDVFDALTSARPYKPAWSIADACAEIVRQRGAHFDPAVADALLRVVRHRSDQPPFVASVAPPSVNAPADRDVGVRAQQDHPSVGV